MSVSNRCSELTKIHNIFLSVYYTIK